MMRPIQNYVLVEKHEVKDETVNGIFIPKTVQEEKDFIFSKVLAVAENITEVKVGDEVLFNRHLADEVEGSYMVQEADILAVRE